MIQHFFSLCSEHNDVLSLQDDVDDFVGYLGNTADAGRQLCHG